MADAKIKDMAGGEITSANNTHIVWLQSLDGTTNDFYGSLKTIVGSMFSGNTETGITVTYQSADATVDFVVENLAADTIDAITEIASGLKSGSDGTLVTGTAGTDQNLIEWDANGDAIDSGLATANVAVASDLVGQQTIWVPAAAMEPRVTTAPATSNAVEIGTSLIALRTMDFATDADDHAGFAIQMPKGWNEGTIVAQFVWSTTGAQTAGLDGVAWFIQAGAYASNDVLTTALGTAVGVTQDHSATANDIMITSETAAITVAGSPGAEEWVYFQVYRDVSDAADDLDIDARLHGVKIHYTTDALTDD